MQTMHHPLLLSPGAHGQPPSTSSGADGSSLSSPQPHTHTESRLDPVSPRDHPVTDVVFSPPRQTTLRGEVDLLSPQPSTDGVQVH